MLDLQKKELKMPKFCHLQSRQKGQNFWTFPKKLQDGVKWTI